MEICLKYKWRVFVKLFFVKCENGFRENKHLDHKVSKKNSYSILAEVDTQAWKAANEKFQDVVWKKSLNRNKGVFY